MTNGLPQGSSLSVLLWLVYVSDMPVHLNTSGLFMDDTALWASSDTSEGLRRSLQESLDRIVSWCQTNRIVLNEDKTKILMNEFAFDFKLRVGNHSSEPDEQAKYFVITL